jgi:hypothetical protein
LRRDIFLIYYRDSLAEIRKIVKEGKPAFADVVQRTESIRSSYPHLGARESIYSVEGDNGNTQSTRYSSSIWSDREFDFDDVIVTTKVYRQALAAVRAGKRRRDRPYSEEHVNDTSYIATIRSVEGQRGQGQQGQDQQGQDQQGEDQQGEDQQEQDQQEQDQQEQVEAIIKGEDIEPNILVNLVPTISIL